MAQVHPLGLLWSVWSRSATLYLSNVRAVLLANCDPRSAVQLYLSRTPPFNTASLAALGAPGTVQLGLFYFLPLPFLFVSRRWPHLLRRSLWIALVVNVASFLASSFAKSVMELIVLQGILGGISGAVLYIPVINYLEQWWVDRRE